MQKKTKAENEEAKYSEGNAPEETVENKAESEDEPADEKAEKIEKLESEAAEQKDKYMRLAAEYANYRRRTENERMSLYDDATAKAVKELLPVADSMQMALENLKDSDPEILKGIKLVSNQLEKSFEKLKITGYGEVGDAFDPNIHNAVSKIESEELGKNTLAAVYQKGYKIGEKVIRHAMVQVANCD